MTHAESQYDYLFKLLIIGDSGVGKSSLLFRFADDNFHETHMPTIGVDFKIRTVEVDDAVIKLQVWDTAGQERFRTITSSYYRGAHGFLVVYDSTDASSFEGVQRWMGEIEKYGNTNSDPVTILVANKCDLSSKRQVSVESGRDLAEFLEAPFLECSAKDATNVEEAFFVMAASLTQRHKRVNASSGSVPTVALNRRTVKLSHKVAAHNGGCCSML